MTYSIVGILATAIMLIINRDVLWTRRGEERTQTQRYYRAFLIGVLVYYVTDALWGILDANRWTALQYADTVVYFIAMIVSVLLWTRYVVAYLEDRHAFAVVLHHAGTVFFIAALIVIVVNLFYPIVFWFDGDGAYQAGAARYALLAIQIVMFLLTSIHTLDVTSKTGGKVRRRHMTIGAFGIAMVVFIAAQVFFPLLPLYAAGYMLGTCLLHSFVVEDEKEEYRQELEEALRRERLQKEELSEGREALTQALDAAERARRRAR